VVSGEILVKFRGANAAQSFGLAALDADISSMESAGRTGAIVIRSRGRKVDELLQTYMARPDVEYAEPNYVWHTMDTPNDALFGQQYALANTGQTIIGVAGTPGADISARQAWDITEGSRNVVVGVVDTGVDYKHPDLVANIWSAPRSFTVTIDGQMITCAEGTHGFNAITRTCDPLDDHGHGTHVSGIIGAAGNNGAGVSGVNRVASIIGSKFLSAGGSGTTLDAIAAIEFLIQVKAIFGKDANIRVLNNSWGGGGFSQALLDEINLATAADMLFVAAAGNAGNTTSGNDDLTNNYPSNYSNPAIVAVAATDNKDALAAFSSFGPTRVHLGAPGVNVLSTWPNGGYAFLSGTSMATPMVTGAAALVLSACPLSTLDLKTDLLNTVDFLPSLNGRVSTGGRLNAYHAITACSNASPSALLLSVSPGSQRLDLNTSVNLTVTATSIAGANLSVFGLPAGVTATFDSNFIGPGTGSATLTMTASPNAVEGTFQIGIAGASGSVSRVTGVLLTVGSPSIAVGQTITGTLSITDPPSPERVTSTQFAGGKHARFYKLTLSSPTLVTIDLKSRVFDTYLYVLSASGTVLFLDDQGGSNNNSRISQTLAAGSYLIEVTSWADSALGDYTLSINTPTITTVTPNFGSPGTTVTVTLSGTRFLSGMTIDAGSGVAVSNVTVISASLATATLTIASNAAPGPRDLTVTSTQGTSNPLTFAVPETIGVGQRTTTASLSTSDRTSTVRLSATGLYYYADLYQFTLSSTTTFTIDMKSTAINAFLYLLSASGDVLSSDDNSGSPPGGTDARITGTLGAGTYFIEATSANILATGSYTLSINLPVIASISPVFLEQGSNAAVTLSGSRFAAPMTIDAGSGITVGNVVVGTPTTAVTNFSVASSASIGPRDVTATTPEGVSTAATVRVVPPIPTISVGQSVTGTLSPTDPQTALASSLAPPGAYADLYRISVATTTPVTITLRSTDFDAVLSVWTAAGVQYYNNDSADPTDKGNPRDSRLSINLIGGTTYFIEVTSSQAGRSGSYLLSVSPLVLLLTTTNFGLQGTVVSTTLLGGQFTPSMTIDAGPGISATVVGISGSGTIATATVLFTIAADAPLGPHNVTITTAAGTTNAVTFTVIQSAASMTTINIGDTLSGRLSADDQASPHRAGEYADFYRLVVTATSPVNIDMKSTALNSYLFLLSSTGSVMASDDNSGGNTNARIGLVVDPGTYYIEATSSVAGIGDYTLSVTLAPPVIASVTPAFGGAGSNIDVTLRGQFFIAPMTFDSEPGVTISNVKILNSNTATARVSISSGASLGDRGITGTSLYGTGDPVYFTVTTASQLNFPRLNSAADMRNTGFAIVNPGPTDASVTFTMYSTAGLQLGTSDQVVPAGGQFSKLGSELFPNVLQSGWVQATSSTAGLQALWLGGDFTNTLDGADAGPAARELVFPLVSSSALSGEINIANVSSVSNTVTLRLFNTGGIEAPSSLTVTIPPNGVYRNSWLSIFQVIPITSGYIRATGTRNITGTSVTPNYLIAPSWTVLNGMDTARQFTEIDFPHVPVGGAPAWTTMLGVTNFSMTSSQLVTMTFTPNTGNPITVVRSLAAGGTLLDSVQTIFGFSSAYQEGWIRVSGSQALNGFLFYGFTGTGGATTVAGQGVSRTQMMFDHVATGPAWNTGLALLNTSNTDANVEIYIMRATGALVGKAAFTLPHGTKISQQLTEWIPASTANDGFVYVRTTNGVPLYAIELFYSRDARMLANIPAADIDPSITYTPPSP
jgi:subtilisin family serine protease